jgi:hypothetical protein
VETTPLWDGSPMPPMTAGFPFRSGFLFSSTAAKKASMSICRILLMEEMIKIKRDYFKSVAIRNGDMARPDRITVNRQILFERCSLQMICSSQSEISI